MNIEKIVTVNNFCSAVMRHAYETGAALTGDAVRRIGHEAANILTGIGGYAELIQYQKPGPDRQAQYLESILKSTGKATENLKAISQAITGGESGKTVIKTLVDTLCDSEWARVKTLRPELNYFMTNAPETWLVGLLRKCSGLFRAGDQPVQLEFLIEGNGIAIAFRHRYALPAKMALTYQLPFDLILRAESKRCAIVLPSRNLRGVE